VEITATAYFPLPPSSVLVHPAAFLVARVIGVLCSGAWIQLSGGAEGSSSAQCFCAGELVLAKMKL